MQRFASQAWHLFRSKVYDAVNPYERMVTSRFLTTLLMIALADCALVGHSIGDYTKADVQLGN